MKARLEAVLERDVSRETLEQLETYARLLQAENERQNLVSTATIEHLWERHIVDSAQLLRFSRDSRGNWVDIGSGAGLPGIPVAILGGMEVTLTEPRRLRADFLATCIERLGLKRVTVQRSKAATMHGQFAIITGRAVAALDRFLEMTIHLSQNGTRWVLPKGRGAEMELEQARRNWQCEVRVEPSLTDTDSKILILARVGRRK